jgi:serine/threonine protein kinase
MNTHTLIANIVNPAYDFSTQDNSIAEFMKQRPVITQDQRQQIIESCLVKMNKNNEATKFLHWIYTQYPGETTTPTAKHYYGYTKGKLLFNNVGRDVAVFVATKNDTGEERVLKVINCYDADHYQKMREYVAEEVGFVQEVAKMAPERVVQILDVIQDPDKFRIVMAMKRYKSNLWQHVGTNLSPPERFSLAKQAVVCLQSVHNAVNSERQRLLHMDVKTTNFLIGDNDEVIIADFELCQRQEEITKLKSTHDRMGFKKFNYVGTYNYSAPELSDSKVENVYTKQSDIYSIGLTIATIFLKKEPATSKEGMHYVDQDMQLLKEFPVINAVVAWCTKLTITERPGCCEDILELMNSCYLDSSEQVVEVKLKEIKSKTKRRKLVLHEEVEPNYDYFENEDFPE